MRKKKHVEVLYRSSRLYKGFTLQQCSTRPGALNILAMPSRICNTYFYPDGRVLTGEQREQA